MKPIVQISLDLTSIDEALETASLAMRAGVDWLEAGTPLILAEGLHGVRKLREAFPDTPIVADLKTMDGGYLEAEMMAKAGATHVVVMARAHEETIKCVVRAGEDYGVKVMGDNLGCPNMINGAKQLEDRGGPTPTTDSGQGILFAPIPPNDRRGLLIDSDPRHSVFVTIVILNYRTRFMPGANSNSRLAIFVTMIFAHNWTRPFANPNPSPDVSIAGIFDHERRSIVVTNSSIVIFVTGIRINGCRGSRHRPNAAAHIPVANILPNQGRALHSLHSPNRNPGVSDMMHDIIDHGAIHPIDRNPRHPKIPDMLVLLIRTTHLPTFLPLLFIILPHTCHRKSIKRRSRRHRHTGHFVFDPTPINDRLLRPLPIKSTFVQVSITPNGNPVLQLNPFMIGPRTHQHHIARRRSINSFLNGGGITGHLDNLRLRLKQQQTPKRQPFLHHSNTACERTLCQSRPSPFEKTISVIDFQISED